MFKDNSLLEKILRLIKRFIPASVFASAQPVYHWSLSMLGAIIYGFPSRSMKVIGVTGTKGKSSVVAMLAKAIEDCGYPVASVGSLGFKIKDRTWPNTLKMTMPGRLKLHKFMAEAKKAGAQYFVLEVTSEGIAQHRLAGITIDCAVITQVRPEHIESHGSFQNYLHAKEQLFARTANIHILNADDAYLQDFARYPARNLVTYGLKRAMISAQTYHINLQLLGEFNKANALAVLAVIDAYSLDMSRAIRSLESIASLPGRMETMMAPAGFMCVIDYAHTPDSLEAVYKTLRKMLDDRTSSDQPKPRLICVLGAAGGGRDKWKRPLFGRLAEQYADKIILTNEDPYDEDPMTIIHDVQAGFSETGVVQPEIILDRKQAIREAIKSAHKGDIVVITGKGSEISMALAGGVKVPWSDKKIAEEVISHLTV